MTPLYLSKSEHLMLDALQDLHSNLHMCTCRLLPFVQRSGVVSVVQAAAQDETETMTPPAAKRRKGSAPAAAAAPTPVDTGDGGASSRGRSARAAPRRTSAAAAPVTPAPQVCCNPKTCAD